MKKSKVIIPAMALLLFSTAASITGTVAWFTSSRVFTTTAGDFAVANVDGNLDVDLVGGVGTKVQDASQKAPGDSGYDKSTAKILIKDAATYKFTHGSFDHGASTAWTLNKDSTGSSDKYLPKGTLANATGTGEGQGEDNWVGTTTGTGTSTVKYFVAMSWKMTFNYDFNQEANNVGIYFNQGSSTITLADSNTATEKTAKTINGFRVAFLPASGGTAKIWGKRSLEYGGTVADNKYPNLGYVKAAAATTGVDHYTTGEYLEASPATYNPAEDGTATTDAQNKARIDRLFTLSKPTGESAGTIASKEVNCVVWFEGEDLDVVSAAEMNIVKLKLDFYARSDYSNS